ncbi:hypothetical protein [uncultured Methanobrevibacter sp.]|uniref:hypothetical protein n=1 Tax=uncultured Methanobrevibacter sp. TaxID=253161 RepID=UPI0025FE93EB|nr:hypothetical protein [uncultured Methanobrevibacter sp.]
MVYYKLNNELNVIELYLEDEEPSMINEQKMKNIGLIENDQKKCWYTQKDNRPGVKFIKDYCDGKIVPTTIIFDSALKNRCCYADSIANFNKTELKEFNATIKTNFKDGFKFVKLSRGKL